MNKLTYKGKQFYIDDKPIELLSGAMHYFRIPHEYWHDRLLKLKECGFNCVETYTCWNLHEPEEGQFNFSGILDIEKYIKTAAEVGLYVILRPGPYICAEWEFGGLPYWLLTYPDMELRCNNDVYVSKVRRYYNELLSRLRPHFAANGGNIIMLQVENEYGSYGDDKAYLRKILEIYKENNIDCFFFTSDGPSKVLLDGGTLPECFSVVNFGSKPEIWLPVIEKYRPDAPLMCGEYWCGWFDHWGEEHHIRNADEIANEFKYFLDTNASINYYMFHGGTNFGFMNGANYQNFYQPTVTSYDYNAPLTEAGDRTELYYKIRELVKDKYGSVPELTATESKKAAYGKVTLTSQAKLFDNLDKLSTPIHSNLPKFMEDIGQDYGYILYRTVINDPSDEVPIELTNVNDRAQVFVDGEYKITYARDEIKDPSEKARLPLRKEPATLDVLVENMGRINYGPRLWDKKGTNNIRLGNHYHFGWDNYPLKMNNLSNLVYESVSDFSTPVFLKGELCIDDTPCDTFLRLDGFKKGFVTINGINVGRYYEIGPTKTLYVPAPFLKQGKNEIIVFETDGFDTPTIQFTNAPDLG